MKKNFSIGITGSIGSGKSEFTKLAEQSGFPVIRADDLSKKILDTNPDVRKQVIKKFGNQAYINNQSNNKYLAQIVFSNPIKLRELERILHPLVIKEIEKQKKEIFKKSKILFIESALIYEADLENLFDYVVLITASREIRLKRKLMQGMTEEDFSKREMNQIPDDEKKKRADFIFLNDGSISELKSKFDLLLTLLSVKS
ncbi:Dephospho-CoA kinase [Ignavibacterium album JCM 16511]|uniref:Dephospho-CoA kinase n=1 Tax=Ignavibacterium album (strain DSM 19864 / JCM 16511 / NBRC 101810 / Mat9-16) TaxID=945713 RepID=I0AJJ7_IGNAJ|nr:dephospho-CoA kinase [Ignavibacterium album]AFH49154.1 Dephospho-CoA kinase [Ignavibacterium album JCM 16511]